MPRTTPIRVSFPASSRSSIVGIVVLLGAQYTSVERIARCDLGPMVPPPGAVVRLALR
jgi:hypothetical protein